jgi:hypothetical protein
MVNSCKKIDVTMNKSSRVKNTGNGAVVLKKEGTPDKRYKANKKS